MQTHHSTDGTTLTVYVTVIVDGVHTDPDGWLADPDTADVVITAQPSATHTGTRISAGNYSFAFTGLTAIAHGTLMAVEINGEIGTVAWTEMVEYVEIIRPFLTSAAQAKLQRSASAMCTCTVTTGATTTSIPTSACSPSGAVLDQFKNRIIIFDENTTTAALRNQTASITGSSNSATPTFTVTALTTAPASGDTFIIV